MANSFDAIERGWDGVPERGVGNVIAPDALGRYLTAVECDGVTYHRTRPCATETSFASKFYLALDVQ